jgi:PAS domain S-box-containing protein
MDQHAIIIADANGVIQLWSAGAAALFGYRATDAVGKKLDLVVPPDLREAHWHGFGHAMKTGDASDEGTFFRCAGPVQQRRGQDPARAASRSSQ